MALCRHSGDVEEGGGIGENALTDNLIALKDPKGNTHRFEYNKRNLKTKETRPLGQAIAYSYDPAGNLASVADPKGQVRRYAYDDAGRRTGESHYLAATDTSATKTVIYSLNDLGSLTGYNDGNTQGTTNYDAKQIRKTGETVNYGIFSLSYSYDYYANGRKKSFTGPDGVTINYSYDSNNQLSGITLPTGTLTVNSYQWTAPAQITLPGGTTRTQGYDALMRLKTIQVKDPTQNEVLNYQYTYDKADNITAKTTEHGSYTYSYDNLYRLTQAANQSPLMNEGYTYDPIGNRLTDSNATGNWSYNENNQLNQAGNITYAYDQNGNSTSKAEGSNTTTYVYDTTDRLIEVKDTNNNTLAKYAYDPLGRRLWKEINNSKTFFFYSDEGLVAETDNSGALTNVYGYKPGSTWGTDTVYLKQGTNYYFYQNDHLGTSQKLIAQDGTVVWSAKAQAFGETIIDPSSSITNNLRFAGQYFDSETGLHYNWNRYYDPKVGRYLQPDIMTIAEHVQFWLIGLRAGARHQLLLDLNSYAYVLDNPLRYADRMGLSAGEDIADALKEMMAGGGLAMECIAKHCIGPAKGAMSWASAWADCLHTWNEMVRSNPALAAALLQAARMPLESILGDCADNCKAATKKCNKTSCSDAPGSTGNPKS